MNRKRRIRSTLSDAKAQKTAIEESAVANGIECSVVNVREAKDRLSELLGRAERGARVVITSDGRPKAMIVRYRPVVRGMPWKSKHAFRQALPLSGDSTPMIRELRDDSY